MSGAAEQVPEDDTEEEKLVSGRPELTAYPQAMAAVVSLCQHVVSITPGGFDTSVMNSVEKKPFFMPPTSTRSSAMKGS